MELKEKQNEFIKLALSGSNIFLTGKAGTGKSHVIKELIEKFRLHKKNVICVAPTGIAAINIDGVTIHSMFNLTTFGICTFKEQSFLNPTKKKVIQNSDVIIIDEVSMLRCDILDGIDFSLKKNHLGSLKDKQIIFVGDLKQLPVVINENTEALLFAEGYNGYDFTNAKIYKWLNVVNIELDEVVRQSDVDFLNALNNVREGKKEPYFKKFIGLDKKGIILAPRNATVEKYNYEGLNNHQGETYTYEAEYIGICKESDFPLEKTIKLKNGVPIMYLVNGDIKTPLRNGTLGKFYLIDGVPTFDYNGIKYPLDRHTIQKKDYVHNEETNELELVEVGRCIQYPIKLAYALSIHKSQGLTFENMTLDISKPCFVSGQLYVALSRVKTPEGLSIII